MDLTANSSDDSASILDIKYELASGPSAWSWEQYEAWLSDAWTDLLASSDPKDEKPLQRFLEQHPCLLPGGDGSGDSFGGHHGSWRDMVISQPMLPGLSRRFPDFMWLTKTSEDLIPVLIEIEAPGKRWLTSTGDRSAPLNQAEGQLAEWKRLLEAPGSQQLFADLYDFPQRWPQRFNLAPRFVLIYGRRAEFDHQPELHRQRRGVRDPTVLAMTYDRLKPLAGSRNAICVQAKGLERRVMAVPPTFRLGPANCEAVALFSGFNKAIAANSLISEERREFLLDRLPYWAEFGSACTLGKRGSYRSSDWE